MYIKSDTLFKIIYRFSKPNIKKIAEEPTPHHELSTSSSGDPFHAEQNVCSGLQILGGGHFFRTEGACSGQASHQRIKTCTGV